MAKYKPADEVLSMSNNISGKVVVITGASSGLGEVTARHLAALGARVVLAARRKDKLDALVAELTNAGGQAIAYQTDVTSQEEVKTLIQGAVDTYGRIDVLINNAGLMAIAPLSDTRTDEWDRMIDINIKGLLYGVAAWSLHQHRIGCRPEGVQPRWHRVQWHQVCCAGYLRRTASRSRWQHPHHDYRTGRRGLRTEIRQHPPTEPRFRGGLLQACNSRRIGRSSYRLRN